MSDDPVILRPVTEGDLPVLEQFLTDPEATGPFQWLGCPAPEVGNRPDPDSSQRSRGAAEWVTTALPVLPLLTGSVPFR
ncbi:hypothetical protein ACFVYT_27700 [Streptomyces sp. NPDC058290]|uniref:hypothetical protein n=1 Tax=Streptomyces sp. NPDC058290 TaxID=3346426 RepID=UPI0036E7F415